MTVKVSEGGKMVIVNVDTKEGNLGRVDGSSETDNSSRKRSRMTGSRGQGRKMSSAKSFQKTVIKVIYEYICIQNAIL